MEVAQSLQQSKGMDTVNSMPEETKPQTSLDDPSNIYIDPEMEKKIIRKFDYLVLPQFVIILILAYLDRSNIGMFTWARCTKSLTNPV